MLDGGAHFYEVYECRDGRFVTLGAIEPAFYTVLLEKCGLNGDTEFSMQNDPARWPALKHRLAEVMRLRSRDE